MTHRESYRRLRELERITKHCARALIACGGDRALYVGLLARIEAARGDLAAYDRIRDDVGPHYNRTTGGHDFDGPIKMWHLSSLHALWGGEVEAIPYDTLAVHLREIERLSVLFELRYVSDGYAAARKRWTHAAGGEVV